MTHVADLLTPAKQCTRIPPELTPLLIKAITAGKCLSRLWFELSSTLTTLYSKLFGKKGLMPEATYKMCVMPAFYSEILSEADFILPM